MPFTDDANCDGAGPKRISQPRTKKDGIPLHDLVEPADLTLVGRTKSRGGRSDILT
jgi:hypothetical protein